MKPQRIPKSLITEPLGLYGWRKLEPVLLAALLSEEPLLLVGSHGCAKSFVLERLAESLGMTFRSYNASLLNAALPDGFADAGEARQASSDFETLWKEFGL